MGDNAQIKDIGKRSMSSGTTTLDPWTNPRKRPHSYDPTAQLESTIDEDIQRRDDKIGDPQASKRMRKEEWPLTNSHNATEPARRKSPSLDQKRRSHSSPRPSRFLEGSMNDKISRQPPSLYTREEQAMERYTSANMEDVDMAYDAGIESNKSSGMFRFGKAIASAFNSVNVWQGFNGIWKEREKENQAKPEKDILKAKAELKYAELKKSGYKGTQNAPARRESQEVPAIKYQDTDDSSRSSFRDSGVDVDGYRSSSDRKNSDQFITSTESLMPPSSLTAGHRSASPFSDASSGRRSSFRFHKPSLEGLKRVKSQVHLPSIKRHAEDAPSEPSIEANQVAGPGLRREASKKDIAKHYKLVKKVSDLENKLEVARRELELSVQDAPPVPNLPAHIGRKRFVPGALPSLPSERLMTPQTHKDYEAVNRSNEQAAENVGMYNTATTTDNNGSNAAELEFNTLDDDAEDERQALWNKRASDIAARNAAARQSKAPSTGAKRVDDLESEAAKGSVSKNKDGRPRKSLVLKFSGSHGSYSVHKHPPESHGKSPRNSVMSNKDEVPPVPVKRTVFDPTKVDRAAIMAMRAIPDSRVAFGKAWDDLKNLRKEYPHATEFELQAYLSSQAAPKKATDHTSVAHRDRPSSPFLDPPASISPMKTRARASRGGISPPPPSLSSPKKFHRNLDAEESPAPANQEPPVKIEEASPPTTKLPLRISEEGPESARASLDKPLPDVKPDEFEWDDDVF